MESGKRAWFRKRCEKLVALVVYLHHFVTIACFHLVGFCAVRCNVDTFFRCKVRYDNVSENLRKEFLVRTTFDSKQFAS